MSNQLALPLQFGPRTKAGGFDWALCGTCGDHHVWPRGSTLEHLAQICAEDRAQPIATLKPERTKRNAVP